MKPRDIAIKDLRHAGYVFDGHGAKHDKYYNESLRRTITLKRHDFDEGDLRYIRKEIKQNQGNS